MLPVPLLLVPLLSTSNDPDSVDSGSPSTELTGVYVSRRRDKLIDVSHSSCGCGAADEVAIGASSSRRARARARSDVALDPIIDGAEGLMNETVTLVRRAAAAAQTPIPRRARLAHNMSEVRSACDYA